MASVDVTMEKAARAVHEAYKGKGTWGAALPAERSKARQAVRLVQAHLSGTPRTPTGANPSKYW